MYKLKKRRCFRMFMTVFVFEMHMTRQEQQQSALPPNIRTDKISLEINMTAIQKPKKKIA